MGPNLPCVGLYTVSVRQSRAINVCGNSTMSNVVRLGVIGAGAIAQRGILPHLSQADVADRVILQAVCDPVPGRAESAAAKSECATCFRKL